MNLDFYWRLRQGEKGWIQLKHRMLWRLTGEDRLRYLNGQATNQLEGVHLVESVYTAITTAKGKMEGDCFVGIGAGCLWLDAESSNGENLEKRLRKYMVADDVELECLTGWSITHCFGEPRPRLVANVHLFRNRRFGLQGWDCWHTGDFAAEGLEVQNELAEVIQLEHGLPRWGVEMGPETLPPEALPTGYGVHYQKGCYVGQEVLNRIRSIGHVSRRLVLMQLSGDISADAGAPLRRDGVVIGEVRSRFYSPEMKSWMIFGYVRHDLDRPGIEVRFGDMTLTIVKPPLSLL